MKYDVLNRKKKVQKMKERFSHPFRFRPKFLIGYDPIKPFEAPQRLNKLVYNNMNLKAYFNAILDFVLL